MGEKAACAWFENGVDTGGVAAANWEGVRPCCEAPCFIGVGVDMIATEAGGCVDCQLVRQGRMRGIGGCSARRPKYDARAAPITSSHVSGNIVSIKYSQLREAACKFAVDKGLDRLN